MFKVLKGGDYVSVYLNCVDMKPRFYASKHCSNLPRTTRQQCQDLKSRERHLVCHFLNFLTNTDLSGPIFRKIMLQLDILNPDELTTPLANGIRIIVMSHSRNDMKFSTLFRLCQPSTYEERYPSLFHYLSQTVALTLSQFCQILRMSFNYYFNNVSLINTLTHKSLQSSARKYLIQERRRILSPLDQ